MAEILGGDPYQRGPWPHDGDPVGLGPEVLSRPKRDRDDEVLCEAHRPSTLDAAERAELYRVRGERAALLAQVRDQGKALEVAATLAEESRRQIVDLKDRLNRALDGGELLGDRLHMMLRALDLGVGGAGGFDATELSARWPEWHKAWRLVHAAQAARPAEPILKSAAEGQAVPVQEGDNDNAQVPGPVHVRGGDLAGKNRRRRGKGGGGGGPGVRKGKR